jgi:hypothetical protein
MKRLMQVPTSRIFLISAFLLLCTISALVAQEGMYNINTFEPSIIDGRAEALGRTSILSSSAADNVFNNPAALGGIESKNVMLSFRMAMGKDSYEYTGSTDEDEASITYNYNYKMHMKINGLAFAMPYMMANPDMKIGFGVGYRNYFDWGFKEEEEIESDDSDVETDWTRDFSGGCSVLTLAGGVLYQGKMSGGLSLSFPFMSSYKSEVESTNEYDEDYTYEEDGTAKASFFTLAGAYQINEKATVALRLRTAFTMKIEYDVDADYDEDDDRSRSDESVDIDVPSELGFALKFTPNTGTNLFIEYLSRGIGEYKEDNEKIWEKANNGYALRLGGEFGTLNTFRCGFFMQSDPVFETDDDGEREDDPLSEMGFTAGFGTHLGANTTLDVFGGYSFLSYSIDSYDWEYDMDIKEDISYTRLKFGATLGYNF